MSVVTTFPNGQALTSSALTPDDINKLVQTLTCGALGLNPPGTVPDYSQVRVNWQTQGQPFQDAPQNRCYVAAVLEDDRYTRVRDLTTESSPLPEPDAVQNWVYTRAWLVSWHFYGPTSTDDARLVHSSMFMDYFTNLLAISNLFPVTDFKEPQRVPELINAQWWEHAHFEALMYETVTETIEPGVVIDVEVKLYDEDSTVIDDPIADITVDAV